MGILVNFGDPTGMDASCGLYGTWSGEGCYMSAPVGTTYQVEDEQGNVTQYTVVNTAGVLVSDGGKSGNGVWDFNTDATSSSGGSAGSTTNDNDNVTGTGDDSSDGGSPSTQTPGNSQGSASNGSTPAPSNTGVTGGLVCYQGGCIQPGGPPIIPTCQQMDTAGDIIGGIGAAGTIAFGAASLTSSGAASPVTVPGLTVSGMSWAFGNLLNIFAKHGILCTEKH